jgi:hypothetical protein
VTAAIEICYGCLMSGINANERRMPSELDIVANAQISRLTIRTLDPKQTSQFTSDRTEVFGIHKTVVAMWTGVPK